MTDVDEALELGEDVEPLPELVVNDPVVFSAKVFVLRALLERAVSVIPTKDLMPVLKNFQVEVKDDELRIVATDLELSVIASTPMVEIDTPGTAVFPAKKLLSIITEAEDGDIVVRVDDKGTASIEASRYSCDIRLMDGSDYPDLPEIDDVEFATVDRGEFLTALRSVRFAACTETVRQNLMMIDIVGGKMRACDGVRFAQVELKADIDLQIPIGAVPHLLKIISYTDVQTMEIGQAENHIVFRVGSDVFLSGKLVAQFPDIEAVLLKPALENSDELIVDRQALAAAIKRVRITADPETSAVALDIGPGTLKVRARDRMGNSSTESLDCGWQHAERTIVLNAKFFLELLENVDVKTCHFFLGPDAKTRKSVLLYKDAETSHLSTLQQMRADHTGQ